MTTIGKFLDASTEHLSRVERDELEAGLDDSTPRVIPHEHGWWIHVPVAECDCKAVEHMPALTAALRAAKKLDCWWINFDADADQVDGLEVYE